MSSSFEIKCTNKPSYMSFCRKSCGGCREGRCRHDIEYLTIFDKILHRNYCTKLLITLIYIFPENLPCYEPFYRLERNQQHSDHGDVCRHTKSRGYYCPVGCFKPKHGSLPFCQTSKRNKSPCRVENGIFQNVSLFFMKIIRIKSLKDLS